MRIGADELLKLRAQAPYDTYRLLVVTDGQATDARLLDSLLPDLMSRGLNVDVIGVAMTETHTLAKSAHTYREAGDAATLTAALSAVFAETSGDSQSSQSDFQMLAGLSEEVAGEIVKSLSAPRNDPLQTVEEHAAAAITMDQPAMAWRHSRADSSSCKSKQRTNCGRRSRYTAEHHVLFGQHGPSHADHRFGHR